MPSYLASLHAVMFDACTPHTLCLTPVPRPLPWLAQDLTAPAVAATGKGCRWNDDVRGLVAAAGLQVQHVEPHVGGLIVSLSAVKPV